MNELNTNRSMTTIRGVIGISKADITPDLGIYSRNWGASTKDNSKGIHMPLELTCMTIQSRKDASPIIFLGMDLGWWKSKEDEMNFRGGIAAALGIPVNQIFGCLSHTHSGPSIWSENKNKPGGEYILPYLAQLKQVAITAIKQSLVTAEDAIIDWMYGDCSLARNRDLYYQKEARYVVGYNPEMDADKTILVGRLSNLKGQLKSLIINYACHPTTLAWENELLSPDFIGPMRKLIEEELKVPCLFLQGASGDLSPIEQYTGDLQIVERHGKQLGYAALAVLMNMPQSSHKLYFEGVKESGAPLGIWKARESINLNHVHSKVFQVLLPIKVYPSVQELELKIQASSDRNEIEKLNRLKGSSAMYYQQSHIEISVWICVIGEFIFIGQSFEAYSKYQEELRKSFPNYKIAVVNFVNGPGGYIANEEYYDEQIYSVINSPFLKGSLEHLIETTKKELQNFLI
ncbi:hypothetical protein ACFRAE_04425 [Sphingobacterium sp. HJSM2_6]|uniref:hypothetical protein n=1 Tax=Sphingobacterium sp. HJSM2_6 TaxID=3366264 RepID=UPI003BC1286F